MQGEYDSDDGDHVTYRNNENGFGLGKRIHDTIEYESTYRSKRHKITSRNREPVRNEDAAPSVKLATYEVADDFVDAMDQREEPRIPDTNYSNSLSNSSTIKPKIEKGVSNHGTNHHQSTNNFTNDDIDIPKHWGDNQSRPVRRIPSSRNNLHIHESSKPVLSNKFRQQTSSLTVAQLSMAPVMFSKSSTSSKSIMAPSRPSWLPQVAVVANVSKHPNNRREIREEIIDDSIEYDTNYQNVSVADFDNNSPDFENLDSSFRSPQPRRESLVSKDGPRPSIPSVLPSTTANQASNSALIPFYSSPTKSKHKSSAPKIGSFRWKFDKITRDMNNLEAYLSSPDLAMTMHDPRSRVNLKLRVTVLSLLGTMTPFVAVKGFVNTFDIGSTLAENVSMGVGTNKAAGVYHALVLLKPSISQENRLKLMDASNIELYEPCVLDASSINSSLQPVLYTFMNETSGGVKIQKVVVCSAWKVL